MLLALGYYNLKELGEGQCKWCRLQERLMIKEMCVQFLSKKIT